jgi:arylsulfatase A-like enzyme
MRRLLKISAVCLLLLALAGSLPVCKRQPSPTNFVFFLVDDLGWTDLSCYGSTFYETPHIDGLAASGVRFTSAYAACPVCSPTRASILTGKFPARLRTTDYFGAPQPDAVPERWKRRKRLLPSSYVDHLPLEEVTLAEALKEAGYATFFGGKWHLGGEGFYPEDQGFDINRGGWERGGPYGGNKYFSPYGNPRLSDGPEGEHLPDRLAEETCRFMEQNRDRPFLAYLSFYSVHTPLIARPDLEKKYQDKAERLGITEETWGEEGERKVRLVQNHAVYAGMVEAMDQAVGKVLDKLGELGLERETVVFLMSDNGGLSTSEGHPTSNLPLRAGKGWLYEGGIREPLLVRWPGMVEQGRVCDEAVVSTDFYPTILEMAGLPPRPGQHLDGVSLVPLLRDGSGIPERPIYWHYPHYGNQGGTPGSVLRLGGLKLIRFYEDDRLELYDIPQDLGEEHNLAAESPEKAAAMKRMLESWLSEIDAGRPLPNPAFREKDIKEER